MIRVPMRPLAFAFALSVMLLFSIGVIRIDSTNPALNGIGAHSGWLLRMLPDDNPSSTAPVIRTVRDAARWLGSPDVDRSQGSS